MIPAGHVILPAPQGRECLTTLPTMNFELRCHSEILNHHTSIELHSYELTWQPGIICRVSVSGQKEVGSEHLWKGNNYGYGHKLKWQGAA